MLGTKDQTLPFINLFAVQSFSFLSYVYIAFPCYTGVKQGCMLSPTLFNLYLSDLPEFLNSSSSTDILLDDSERPINCLLYADDLVIFSRSANGLQTLLNKLESYCEKTELTLNLDKTKVIIFNNCGKSLRWLRN